MKTASTFSPAIRTEARKKYYVLAIGAALADPFVAGHVRLGGTAFPPRTLSPADGGCVLERLLAARDPATGSQLRWRANADPSRGGRGKRLKKAVMVHGIDIEFSADKSLSIAALLFLDEVVARAVYDEEYNAAKRLAERAKRRVRKNGKRESILADNCPFVAIPEKASRYGDPHAHTHAVFPNLTSFQRDDGVTVWHAADFLFLVKSTAEERRRMNRRLFRRLSKLGYAVDFDGSICTLPSVPRALCEELSQASKQLGTAQEGRVVQVSSRRLAQIREQQNRCTRPEKKYHTHAELQANWGAQYGAERIVAMREQYLSVRHVSPTPQDCTPAPEITPAEAVAAKIQISPLVPESTASGSHESQLPVKASSTWPTQPPSDEPISSVGLSSHGGELASLVPAGTALGGAKPGECIRTLGEGDLTQDAPTWGGPAGEAYDELLDFADHFRLKSQIDVAPSGTGTNGTGYAVSCDFPAEEGNIVVRARLVSAALRLLLGRAFVHLQYPQKMKTPNFRVTCDGLEAPPSLSVAVQQFGLVAHDIAGQLPPEANTSDVIDAVTARLEAAKKYVPVTPFPHVAVEAPIEQTFSFPVAEAPMTDNRTIPVVLPEANVERLADHPQVEGEAAEREMEIDL